MKLRFFQNVDFCLFWKKTQLTGHIKKEHEIIILDLCNFDLKICEIQKYFLVFADF